MRAWLSVLVLGTTAAVARGDGLRLSEAPGDAAGLAREVLLECFDPGACGTDATTMVGEVPVRALHVDSGSDSSELLELGTGYFDAGVLTLAVGHMSEDMYRERRDHVVLTTGTLPGGGAALLVELDFSAQSYREGRVHGHLGTVSRGPWIRHAKLTVCSLGPAPRCSLPITQDCPKSGCRASLAEGVITVATAGTAREALVP